MINFLDVGTQGPHSADPDRAGRSGFASKHVRISDPDRVISIDWHFRDTIADVGVNNPMKEARRLFNLKPKDVRQHHFGFVLLDVSRFTSGHQISD